MRSSPQPTITGLLVTPDPEDGCTAHCRLWTVLEARTFDISLCTKHTDQKVSTGITGNNETIFTFVQSNFFAPCAAPAQSDSQIVCTTQQICFDNKPALVQLVLRRMKCKLNTSGEMINERKYPKSMQPKVYLIGARGVPSADGRILSSLVTDIFSECFTEEWPFECLVSFFLTGLRARKFCCGSLVDDCAEQRARYKQTRPAL